MPQVLRKLDRWQAVVRAYGGNYGSSIDMAGGSVTLLHLDAALKRWS